SEAALECVQLGVERLEIGVGPLPGVPQLLYLPIQVLQAVQLRLETRPLGGEAVDEQTGVSLLMLGFLQLLDPLRARRQLAVEVLELSREPSGFNLCAPSLCSGVVGELVVLREVEDVPQHLLPLLRRQGHKGI